MHFMTGLLGRIAYEFTLLQTFIPTYLLIIFSATFTVFIGAHASLSRPASAAEPSTPQKDAQNDNDEEDNHEGETEQKMEGLSPIDAFIFPLLAGCTLTGLYFLLKWLEDPAVLNKILNLYFSIFGIFTVVRLLTDSMGFARSFAFPSAHTGAGKVWRADQRRRKMVSLALPPAENASPLPGWFSTLKMPRELIGKLWSLRNILSAKLRVRVHVYKIFTASFRVSAPDFIGLFAAIIALGYYNFVDKPWWLTNLLGISFAYSALQFMSPKTFWTGTMVLSALFVYDIYFVFYTALMVTVATKIDIPAKLLFPRPFAPGDDPRNLSGSGGDLRKPSGSGEHPSKPSFAILGLGDIVLPGIMIGLALRFDLYLFYLRKQYQRNTAQEKLLENKGDDGSIVKAEWLSATGNWGERFWIGRNNSNLALKEQAGVFPKTYFYASLFGYLVGLLATLGIMQLSQHAQPALLYLVPCVLGTLWGTALIKGDAKLMWEYKEATDEKEKKSIISPSRLEGLAAKVEPAAKETDMRDDAENSVNEGNSDRPKSKGPIHNDRKDELIHFSISLPGARIQNVSQNSTSKEEGSEGLGETRKPAPEPKLYDVPRLLSTDGTGPSNVSTSLSSLRQENMGQEPPEKRKRSA